MASQKLILNQSNSWIASNNAIPKKRMNTTNPWPSRALFIKKIDSMKLSIEKKKTADTKVTQR